MPDLHSTARAGRVVRLDGRTVVVHVHRRGADWERVRGRLRPTCASLERLQRDRVLEVEVRRWFRRARASSRLARPSTPAPTQVPAAKRMGARRP